MVAEEGRWEGVSPWKVLLCTALEALVGASGTVGARSAQVSARCCLCVGGAIIAGPQAIQKWWPRGVYLQFLFFR